MTLAPLAGAHRSAAVGSEAFDWIRRHPLTKKVALGHTRAAHFFGGRKNAIRVRKVIPAGVDALIHDDNGKFTHVTIYSDDPRGLAAAIRQQYPLAQREEDEDMEIAEIIKIERNATIGGLSVNAVHGRQLHQWLKVGRDFSNWMKDRIDRYGFEEGVDFVKEVSARSGENPSGGRPTTEYLLTLDTAKEVAMVENNTRGRQARRYFIEIERRYREQTPALDSSVGEQILRIVQETNAGMARLAEMMQRTQADTVAAIEILAEAQTAAKAQSEVILEVIRGLRQPETPKPAVVETRLVKRMTFDEYRRLIGVEVAGSGVFSRIARNIRTAAEGMGYTYTEADHDHIGRARHPLEALKLFDKDIRRQAEKHRGSA